MHNNDKVSHEREPRAVSAQCVMLFSVVVCARNTHGCHCCTTAVPLLPPPGLCVQVCGGVGVHLPEGAGWGADLLPGPAGAHPGGSEVHPGIPVHRWVLAITITSASLHACLAGPLFYVGVTPGITRHSCTQVGAAPWVFAPSAFTSTRPYGLGVACRVLPAPRPQHHRLCPHGSVGVDMLCLASCQEKHGQQRGHLPSQC